MQGNSPPSGNSPPAAADGHESGALHPLIQLAAVLKLWRACAELRQDCSMRLLPDTCLRTASGSGLHAAAPSMREGPQG